MTNKLNAGSRKGLQRFSKRLRKDDEGFTAVEFALVAIPFLALLLGFIEVALVYGGTVSLENAVEQAARKIRTGQGQSNSGYNKSQFVNDVCDRVTMLPDCPSRLVVDVQAFPDFQSMSAANVGGNALDGSGDLRGGFGGSFDTGGGGSVVLVTTYYKWELMGQIPGLDGFGLSNQTDKSRLLSAVAAFRNEPFDD